MPALIITTGPEAGRRFELEAEVVIGRGKVDCVIADAELSRRHAAARPVAGGVEIEDLGSLNGTWFDGRRLDGPVRIPDGGAIRIGETEIVIDLTASASATASAATSPPAAESNLAPPPPPELVAALPPPAAESILGPPPPSAESILGPPPLPPSEPIAAQLPPEPALPEPEPPQPARAQPVGPSPETARPAPLPAASKGTLRAGGGRGRRRVATRMVVPALVTFLVICATAVALIVYFATR